MKKKISLLIAGTAVSILTVVGPVSPASAAHCVETNEPGFSYFGTDHVQEKDHNGAEPGQPEGGKVHAGTPGASNCRTTAGNPSVRAPGQN